MAKVKGYVIRFDEYPKESVDINWFERLRSEGKISDYKVDDFGVSVEMDSDIDIKADKIGIISSCSLKYSNCRLCKHKELPMDSKECAYCSKNNKSTEYYV